jgi:hypothetical protein
MELYEIDARWTSGSMLSGPGERAKILQHHLGSAKLKAENPKPHLKGQNECPIS